MDPLTKASSLASGDPWIGIPITPYMYPSFLTWFPEPVSFLLIYLPRQQLSSGYQRYNGHWGTLHHQTGFGKRRCRSTTRTATLYRQFLNGSSWVAFFSILQTIFVSFSPAETIVERYPFPFSFSSNVTSTVSGLTWEVFTNTLISSKISCRCKRFAASCTFCNTSFVVWASKMSPITLFKNDSRVLEMPRTRRALTCNGASEGTGT